MLLFDGGLVSIPLSFNTLLKIVLISTFCTTSFSSQRQGRSKVGFTFHLDRNLRSELNIAPCVATHDWPDMSLTEADDSVRNSSVVRLVKNVLLTDQLADDQQLLKGISTSCQKDCTTSG
jgi:hypothetical protein